MDINIQIQRLIEAGIALGTDEEAEYLAAPDTHAGGDVPIGYKRCGKCKKILKYYMFNRNKEAKTNCSGNCKECQKQASSKAYHKSKGSRDYKENYARNREKKLAASREYYAANKEKILAKQKQYHGTSKGRRTMKRSHAKRKYLLERNAGIPWNKDIVIDRDKKGGDLPICVLCGEAITRDKDIHMEHLIPVVLGGLDCFTNVGCAHQLCNLRKSKDAREITAEQVDDLVQRSEDYIDAHKNLFDGLFGEGENNE